MAEHMIIDRAVVPTRFVVDPSEEAEPTRGTAIPLARWLSLRSEGADLSETGVILFGDTDLEPLKPLLDSLPFVAIDFPKFADGRGYSHARRLRELWGYDGTILAYGDVLRDQLFYMSRCGFNAFLLRDDQDPWGCLAAFQLYREPYQYS